MCRFRFMIAASLVIALGAITIGAQGPAATSQITTLLRGTIFFEGTAPQSKTIVMRSESYCTQFAQRTEEVRVSEGGLENVMVYISSPVSADSSQLGSGVTLEHRECRLEPHVITLQVGQPLLIKNSDPMANNLHAWSEVNRPFNTSLTGEGVQTEHTFDKPEKAFPIRDDIHNWKVAFAAVFTHPFHTVSKARGSYELRVPVGEYEITAWHEKLGTTQRMVRITPGENPPLNFVFKQR